MTTNSVQFVCRGDIILVDFKKNEGSEQNGVRPAIVVQNDTGNTYSPTTIVCPLTSHEKNMNETHVLLYPEDCGIVKPSVVLCEQIRVIDKSRIMKKIGYKVTPNIMKAIEKKMMVSFGIYAS